MIKVEHLEKYYKNKQILYDFSTEIHNNERCIYGLVGPNGSGKTTFLKTLTGLLTYSGGSISVDGEKDYYAWCRNNIAFIQAGDRGMKFNNTVYDNIMFFGAMKRNSDKKTKMLIEEYSEYMNFNNLLKRDVRTLSTGQKKKAMLLCGLCSDMSLIIMDEPSNGLDIDAQLEINSLVKNLVDEKNKTFIISSHDVGFLSGIADNYTFIYQGRKILESQGVMRAEEIVEMYEKVKYKYESND